MRFRKRVRHHLFFETKPDFQRIGTCFFEEPVIKSTAASETPTLFVEGEARADEGVDFAKRHFC